MQYEVAYTGYNPVLNPVFLARNRMLARVVAKQAKTTKVKNKFVNGKKGLCMGGRHHQKYKKVKQHRMRRNGSVVYCRMIYK